ncbi:MAG: TIGR02710 family CRISPR-associated protein [Deltaproteobacteria bacterium]|nr:TIGR02710 family CRISPR-associated protein [Deltaproteobacteria bacterium]
MTILIATVGGAPAPVIHAIQQTRPGTLALIASRKGQGTDKGSVDEIPAILEAAGWSGPEPITETLDRPDELAAVWETCEALAARLPGDARIVANYSGGTKSMSAGLVTFALRAGWELQIQSARRNDLVKVTANDNARKVAIGGIVAADVRRQADQLAARHDHDGAATLLERLLADHALPTGLADAIQRDIARHRFDEALDRYDFETAASLLADRGTALSQALGATWAPRLRAFRQTLAWLATTSEPAPKKIADALDLVRHLIDTARRTADRGRCDDAFSRLYRATELLAQIVLRFTFDLRTGDLDRGRLPAAFVTRLPAAETGPLRASLMQAYTLLADLDHPLGRFFVPSKDRLRALLENRNASWLAHGFLSVTPSMWRTHGEAWIRWLEDAAKAAVA